MGQRLVDLLGQRQQHGAPFLSLLGGGSGEHDAVVLIGVQRLLLTPLTAKTQPTERHTRITMLGDTQLDHTAYGVIIEQRNDSSDLP